MHHLIFHSIIVRASASSAEAVSRSLSARDLEGIDGSIDDTYFEQLARILLVFFIYQYFAEVNLLTDLCKQLRPPVPPKPVSSSYEGKGAAGQLRPSESDVCGTDKTPSSPSHDLETLCETTIKRLHFVMRFCVAVLWHLKVFRFCSSFWPCLC